MMKPRIEPMVLALQRSAEMSYWVRPRSWRGKGHAYVWDDGKGWLVVPSLRGGEPAAMPTLSEIGEPWEVVDPDTVVEEYKMLRGQ